MCDVRRDARAFLSKGFLGDLNDNLLALFEEVRDRGHRGPLSVRALGTSLDRRSLGTSLRAFRPLTAVSAAIPAVPSAIPTAAVSTLSPFGSTFFPRLRSAGLGGGSLRGRHIAIDFSRGRTALRLFAILSAPHLAAHPARHPMWITMPLLAKSRSEAGGNTCGFRAFFFRGFF